MLVALIDSESVAIATLWRLLTPTVGVNSLGLLSIAHSLVDLLHEKFKLNVLLSPNNSNLNCVLICDLTKQSSSNTSRS